MQRYQSADSSASPLVGVLPRPMSATWANNRLSDGCCIESSFRGIQIEGLRMKTEGFDLSKEDRPARRRADGAALGRLTKLPLEDTA